MNCHIYLEDATIESPAARREKRLDYLTAQKSIPSLPHVGDYFGYAQAVRGEVSEPLLSGVVVKRAVYHMENPGFSGDTLCEITLLIDPTKSFYD